MKQYLGITKVNAKEMTRKEYNDLRGWQASQTDMLAEDWVIVE